METINRNTKRGQSLIKRYEQATATELSQVYGKPSAKKQYAYKDCRNLFASEQGPYYGAKNFKVISAGPWTFSVAWMRADGTLRVETAGSSILVR